MQSVTAILLSSSNTASICPDDNYLSTIYPKITDPFPHAPDITVPS
jgi:hypothetical protein